MGSKSKIFWIANFVLAFIFISAVVFAWNNPPGNPPTGSGAIATDGSNNVGVGTAAPTSKLTVRRSDAGVALSVRDTGDAADVFTVNAAGQVGAGVVPGGATRLGIGATAAYIWPVYITTTDGTGRVAGINFSQTAGLTDSVAFGAPSAGHHLRLLAGGGTTRLVINSSGRVGIGNIAPADLNTWDTRLAVIDPAYPTVPAISRTIGLFGSSDGTTGGSSIRARGTISGQLADLAEYVRVRGGVSDYEPGDILEVDSAVPDQFKKSETAYGQKLAGVISQSGSFIMGEEGVEFDASGRAKNHVQLALAGRVPVKVVGPVAIGDAITSSDLPGIGMAAQKSGRVIGFALENWRGTGIGYVKILINPHYWIAE
jgi:hypothetical protein